MLGFFFCHNCGNPAYRRGQRDIPICLRCHRRRDIEIKLALEMRANRLSLRRCKDCGDFVPALRQFCKGCKAARRKAQKDISEHKPRYVGRHRELNRAIIRVKRQDPEYKAAERLAVRDRMRRLRLARRIALAK